MTNVTVSRILWGKAKNTKAFATGVEYINTAGKKLTVVGPILSLCSARID
jgi:hypothetical protein